jgi:putative RNA 2'-phosphotransferase
MSLLLRHKPEQANLDMDREGWVSIKQMQDNVPGLSMAAITWVVEGDKKGRFAFNEDRTKVRATQGHSTELVDMKMKAEVPPTFLYHGSAERFMKHIRVEGLKSMTRHYVHMTNNRDTAFGVAMRYAKDKRHVRILTIDAAKMHADGFAFYQSENNVWLTEHVPLKYLHGTGLAIS